MLDPNGVLREWRERKTGLSQRAAARGIPASPAALNAYEKPGGNIPAETSRILDRLYGAGGMLEQFVGAAAVPAAYDARGDWVHNFLNTTGPVWAWVRPENPSGRFTTWCHWGAFELEISGRHVNADPNGFIITAPIAVALPAVFIKHEPPGWVSFGSGVPPSDLGIPVLSGIPLVRRFSGLDMTVGAIGRGLRKRFGRPTQEELEGLKTYSEIARELFASDDHRAMQTVEATTSERPSCLGGRVRRARRSHRLSQDNLADLATEILGVRVSQDTISRLEQDRSIRTPYLHSALDGILRGDGRLCCDVVAPTRQHTYHFPRSYNGPIWVELRTQHSVLAARFQWNEWVKELQAPGSTVVRMRAMASADPFQITTSEGVQVIVGTGWREGAADVNDNWFVESSDHEEAIWRRAERVIREVLRSTPSENEG